MTVNPFIPQPDFSSIYGDLRVPGKLPGSYQVEGFGTQELNTEGVDEYADHPGFPDVQVGAVLGDDDTIDIAFKGIKVDEVDEFFGYIDSDKGAQDLFETIIKALLGSGQISAAEALVILLGL